MLYEKKYQYLSCFVKYRDMYIVVSSTSNQIFFWNTESEQVIETIYLEKEQKNGKNLFSQCLLCGDDLILIPESAMHLIIYELNNKKMFYFDISENYLKMVKTDDQMFFLMGCKTGNLYQLDIVKKELRLRDHFDNRMLTDEKLKPWSDLIFMNGIFVNDKIVFPFRRYSQIYIFDINTNEGIIKTISENTGFVDLVYEEGIYYLLSEHGIIYMLDDEFCCIGEIQFHLDNKRQVRYPFRYISIYQKQVILLPMYIRKIIKINIKKNEFLEVDASKEFSGTGRYYIDKGNKESIENKIVVLQSENTNGCHIDMVTGMIMPFLRIEAKENTLKSFLRGKNSIVIEENCFEIGKQIWGKIKNEVEFYNGNAKSVE